MMILARSYIGLLIICSLSCGVREVIVMEDQAGNFNLGRYETFDFLETGATGDLSDNYQESVGALMDEITEQMTRRGIEQTAENPDLRINIGILMEEKVQTRETGLVTDPGTFNYIGQQRYTWRSQTVEAGRYRLGTVTVHLVDTDLDKAVWVGVVEKTIANRPARIERISRKAAQKLFDRLDEYP
ncbi:DUF4136 domain-containing protein [Negadavirga shengliensis]|uniref:DUF4136 domain-containing protein n=1 Tax=Negadavirga shengliensis TaxID=1389218 RepID=A0ABV9SZK4_9BACT